MEKTLKIIKTLATVILSMVTIAQYNTMTTQAKQVTLKRSTPSEAMNESETAIIKDIKQACLYLASRSISPEDVAAKFGTPAKEPLNANEVEPFNRNLKTISTDVSIDSEYPSAADTVNFTPKPGKISVEALRQEFGEYSHIPANGPYATEFVRFDTKVMYNGIEKDCEIHVEYERTEDRFLPVDVKNENVAEITVIFNDVVL
jgi:hypothetical protein